MMCNKILDRSPSKQQAYFFVNQAQLVSRCREKLRQFETCGFYCRWKHWTQTKQSIPTPRIHRLR